MTRRLYLACVLAAILTPLFALRAQDPPNTMVRVVTITGDGLTSTGDQRLTETIERLDRAASFRPDIAVLPEVFLRDTVETVPGKVTTRLAAWAREHSSYLIFGLKTRVDGRTHNSAILLDRQGNVAGRYDKIHPTESELRAGITPGDPDPPVFQTDFGVIGIQICFDVNWWKTWKQLKQKGARIVFFPAAYPAATQLAMLALRNEYYVVSSTGDRPARIYDITGRVIAKTGRFQRWAGAALPLGKRLFEIDFHTRKVREIQQKYGDRVEVIWYHDDDWFTLASLDPELTTEAIIKEFGLTPLDDYRRRAEAAIVKARSRR